MKIHIDLDCFFVSAERILDPSLEGKAVGIGGRSDQHIFSRENTRQTMSLANSGAFVMSFFQESSSSTTNDLDAFIDPDGRVRGILTTSSYQARAFGIYTGCTINEALQKCPQIIIKKPNMKLYQRLSHELHDFLRLRIPLLEQGSIDEFYGDLEGWVEDEDVPSFIKALQAEVLEKLKLPLSIGAAKSKYTAKLATGIAKPYGTRTVYPAEVDAFIKDIPIGKFPGIGAKTRANLQGYGLQTLGDVQNAKSLFLNRTKSTWELYLRVCGIDTTPIEKEHIRKSIGISRTFDPIRSREEAKRRLTILSRHLGFAIMRMEVIPTHFCLEIAYELGYKGKASLCVNRLFSDRFFKDTCQKLFKEADSSPSLQIIRIGISTSQFTTHSHRALSLLEFEADQEQHALSRQSKKLREKYGLDTLRWGSEI
ncbi:MAG: DNA polymerase IV [Campylobacterales bacterium]|nr:DNA polymerase IV [Campylobacterales bacterium]MBE0499696.1 DNA polymerase IV [Campylobacterales bacterium]